MMTSKTLIVIDQVERMIAAETRDPDSQVIGDLIQSVLSGRNGFDFARQQRPEPAYYKKLLRADASQHAEMTKGNTKDGRMFRIAYDDLRRVLGDFSGPGIQKNDFTAGKKSRLATRLEALNLCLEVQPAASRDVVNAILSKHLGASPLHLRNPVDAIYAFTLSSRDAGDEAFATLRQQHAFIDRMLRLADELALGQKQQPSAIRTFDALDLSGMPEENFAGWFISALSDRNLLRISMGEPRKNPDDDHGPSDAGMHSIAVELITHAPERRAARIARKRERQEDYLSADRLLREIIGENYSGNIEPTPLRFRAVQSMEPLKSDRPTALRQRRDDLDLILSISPALDEDGANRLLTQVLGVPALDGKRAVDAVYIYLLRIRAGRMPDPAQQRAFAGDLFARAEAADWGAPQLPSTQSIAASLDEIAPGDAEGFADWLTDSFDHLDRVDHHYWARIHFGDSLRKISRGNDASRLTALTTGFIDRSPSAADREELRYLDIGLLKDQIYRQIEDQNTLSSDDTFLSKLLQYSTGAYTTPDQTGFTQGQAYLSAMEIMTDCVGLDFYNIWHAIGVKYLLDAKGILPPDFPEAQRWTEYYGRMTADGDNFDAALWVRMDDEPDYLAALRKFAASGALPKEISAQIRAVSQAAVQYEALMGRSSLFYIMSDWHYACIAGEYTPGSSAANAPDDEARRIERVTSRTNRVYDEDRTDVLDVPRGLLILSELARIYAAPSGRYTARQLVRHVNLMLADCGYALLDVRRELDLMFYCAIRIAELHAGDSDFSFDHILSGLHEYTRCHIFTDLIRELLRLYDFDPFPDE